jgi:hypothetical protein
MLTNNSSSGLYAVFLLIAFVFPALRCVSIPIDENEEIVLYFNYPSAGQHYITVEYYRGKVFLPVLELFGILGVHAFREADCNSFKGTWLQHGDRWKIDLISLTAKNGKNKLTFSDDDFRLKGNDIFLLPGIFSKIFGLRFSIDMNYLKVMLNSDEMLPVDLKRERERKHAVHKLNKSEKKYPLLFPRERRLWDGGILDYNLGIFTGTESGNFNYSISGGMELFGGDMKASLTGFHNDQSDIVKLGHLNWRYVKHGNPFLTTFRIGNILTGGILARPVIGAGITNMPLIPPRIQSKQVTDGFTDPGSEIELFINKRLIDFTKADENGYYRFEYNQNYGSAMVSIKIYKPGGEIIIKKWQIELPFSVMPEGKFYYSIQGGVPDNLSLSGSSSSRVFHGDIGWAMRKNLTLRIGGDYFNNYEDPSFYAGLSARFFEQYFADLDFSPENFFRTGARVRYASGTGARILYTAYSGGHIYNPGDAREKLYAWFYLPFRFPGLANGFRTAWEHVKSRCQNRTGFSAGFISQIKGLNIRIDYSGQCFSNIPASVNETGFISLASGYHFSSGTCLPAFLRGMYINAGWRSKRLNFSDGNAGFRFTKSLWHKGQCSFDLGYDVSQKMMNFHTVVSLDLKPFRLVSRYAKNGETKIFRQNISGSILFERESDKIVTSNRAQTGMSGISVLMFSDSNGNGCFDKGETVIPAKAIRIDQSAKYNLGEDGILRISRLTGYRKYNAEIISEALPDPLLAPLFSKFSFITEPNRFKRIEIPLYGTGILEGKVTIREMEKCYYRGGIRLIITATDREFKKIISTFSDGTFYCMELLPGTYTLEVDPRQLDFPDAESLPEYHNFEVKADEVDSTVKKDFILDVGAIFN